MDEYTPWCVFAYVGVVAVPGYPREWARVQRAVDGMPSEGTECV
jgi:hypothetical protein